MQIFPEDLPAYRSPADYIPHILTLLLFSAAVHAVGCVWSAVTLCVYLRAVCPVHNLRIVLNVVKNASFSGKVIVVILNVICHKETSNRIPGYEYSEAFVPPRFLSNDKGLRSSEVSSELSSHDQVSVWY